MKGLTEIISIIDRSGSMHSIKSDAIGGFNNFLNEQKKLPDKAIATTVLFDTVYEMAYSGVNIKHVGELNENNYRPRGGTALLDAIGKTITDVNYRLQDTPESERPEKVIVVILTDGEENASHEYTQEAVRKLISAQRENGWEFIYLGANQDAFTVAKSMGISHSAGFRATGQGVTTAYNTVTNLACTYRSTGTIDTDALDTLNKSGK